MGDSIRVLISEDEIRQRTAELGAALTKDYEGKEITAVCLLKGGVFFMAELCKRIERPMTFDFMVVSSYGSGTVSSGNIRIRKDLDMPVEGKDVLIVEDIIDSGNTLSAVKKILENRGAKSIKIVTLLDKPARREVKDISVDYSGFEIEDLFVVGYGMDFDERYRNLPYIGVVEQKAE